MKVISKTKEFNAIEINDSREFYINVGKYLNDDQYVIEDEGYCSKFYLVDDNGKHEVRSGDYILIEAFGTQVMYITKENFKENYVEIKEEK